MIVATKYVNIEELLKHTETPAALDEYVRSLIPKYAEHIPHILDNQKYYVAVLLRGADGIDFKQRKLLCEELVSGIKMFGYLNEIIDLRDIFDVVDKDKLLRNLEEVRNRC